MMLTTRQEMKRAMSRIISSTIDDTLSTILDEVDKANNFGLHHARVVIDHHIAKDVLDFLNEYGYGAYKLSDGAYTIFWESVEGE